MWCVKRSNTIHSIMANVVFLLPPMQISRGRTCAAEGRFRCCKGAFLNHLCGYTIGMIHLRGYKIKMRRLQVLSREAPILCTKLVL
jgi:hypothetical protein